MGLEQTIVELVDSMGDDLRIVNCARVSYGKHSSFLTEGDKGLIDYLMRNRHTTPFESVKFTFRVKLPIFVARQLMRHRTSSFNEISGRYVDLPEDYFVPKAFPLQSDKNKQGRKEEFLENSDEMVKAYDKQMGESFSLYKKMTAMKTAKELARINLPLATMTEMMWTIDLHNLLHFLGLRLHHHAQLEIRDLAQKVLTLIKPIVPVAVAAWERNVFYGAQLTQGEMALFESYLVQDPDVKLRIQGCFGDKGLPRFAELFPSIAHKLLD